MADRAVGNFMIASIQASARIELEDGITRILNESIQFDSVLDDASYSEASKL